MRLSAVVIAAALALVGGVSGGPKPAGQLVFDAAVGGGDQFQVFRERADGSGRVRLTWGDGDHRGRGGPPTGAGSSPVAALDS